ncbi:MAG: hypothetical protein KQH63_15545 [Desulfobulbaceae bacterium]|nr:hypothetical protein [Desulfobulbaceae bacterium]
MEKNNTILLAIRTQGYQGGKILGNRWLPLIDELRQAIAKSGIEDSASSDELLLFTYSHPFVALTSLQEGLDKCKAKHGWQETQGALPVQIVLHLIDEENGLPQLREPSAPFWDLLQQETFYITQSLKKKWDEFMAGRELPGYTLEDEGSGLFQIVFSGKAVLKKVELFSYRHLPVRGDQKECFYCGMTSHAPVQCPSKLLSMKMQGITHIGYLTFEDLNSLYKKIFPDYSECSKKIAVGATPTQLRKDKELLVFVSYFDLNRLYQLRFLINSAFSLHSKWDDQDKTDKINIDSRNLHMGLDCLRVGQYERAEELLSAEGKRRDGKQFYASIGLAFWALEQGRTKDMGHYLEKAKNIASMEKERLYSQLLLSRYYELENDSWKAKEALNHAIQISFDALDCQYRRMQHNVRYGFDKGDLKKLRMLMMGQKEIFMSALMDPLLLPVQGLVNDVAFSHIQHERQEAQRNLSMAEKELSELSYWIDEKDKVITENREALEELRKKFKRQTYYDLLDIVERAKGIAFGCQRIRKAKVEELEEKIKSLTKKSEAYQTFWKVYPYKSYFRGFQQALAQATTLLKEAQVQVNKKKGPEYKAAINLLEQVEKNYSAMSEMQGKMIWLKLFLNGTRLFVKNLIIMEIVLFLAGCVVFFVLPTALSGSSYEGLSRIVSDPVFRKKTMLVTVFFFAPAIATMWTVWKLQDE